MINRRSDLTRYYNELDTAGKDGKPNQAQKATEHYFKATALWIENDDKLTKEILPKMQALGADVVRLAFDSAGDAAKGMIATPVSYTHLDVYKRQLMFKTGWSARNHASPRVCCCAASPAPRLMSPTGWRKTSAIFWSAAGLGRGWTWIDCRYRQP